MEATTPTTDEEYRNFSETPGLLEWRFETARDFLAALRPSHTRWTQPGSACPWIFRGQSNADWALTPKVWRPESLELLKSVFPRVAGKVDADMPHLHGRFGKQSADVAERYRMLCLITAAEMQLVSDFVALADELGFRVPSESPMMGSDWAGAHGIGDFRRANLLPAEAFALAQHHGVPTRLLDFTRNPLVAAYFAAEGAGSVTPSPTAIAVWAYFRTKSNSPNVGLITCPHHEFDFLHAQEALFVFDKDWLNSYVNSGTWRSLEPAIIGPRPSNPYVLRKLVLPASEAEDLLKLLWPERCFTQD